MYGTALRAEPKKERSLGAAHELLQKEVNHLRECRNRLARINASLRERFYSEGQVAQTEELERSGAGLHAEVDALAGIASEIDSQVSALESLLG